MNQYLNVGQWEKKSEKEWKKEEEEKEESKGKPESMSGWISSLAVFHHWGHQ